MDRNCYFKINAFSTDARTVSLHCVVQTVSRHSGFLQNGFQGLFNHTGNEATVRESHNSLPSSTESEKSSFYLPYILSGFIPWGLGTE